MSRDVVDRLAAADPSPARTAMPDAVWSATALREAIDERRDLLETPTQVTRGRRLSGWAYGLAAAVVVLLGGVVGWLIANGNVASDTTADQGIVNGWVAFAESGEDGSDIFIVREGANPRRIVGSVGDGFDRMCPSFSPDGSKIGYIERGIGTPGPGGGGEQVVVVDFDGRADAPEIFRSDATSRGCPTWSPDSTRLAYVTPDVESEDITSQWELNIATLDGEITPLFDGFSSHFHIQWSPDGSAIAVAGRFNGDQDSPETLQLCGVSIVPVDGSEPRWLVPPSETNCWTESISWAPDGSRLAILGGTDGGAIRVVGIDGRSVVTIPVNEPGQFDVVAWSPDGARLAYVDRGDGLTLVNPDGTDPVQVPIELPFAATPIPQSPVWSPDGRRLLVAVWGPGDRIAIASVSPEPGTPATVLYQSDEATSDISGTTWARDLESAETDPDQ